MNLIKRCLKKGYIIYLYFFDFINKIDYFFYLIELFFKTGQIKNYEANFNDFKIFGDKYHLIPFIISNNKKNLDWNNKINILKYLLPKNPVIVDVGANVGVVSLLYSNIKGSLVYAIEPISSNYNLLLKNINYNKSNNIKPFRIGMSDKNDVVFFGNPTKKQGWRYSFSDSKDKAFSSIYAEKVIKKGKIVNGEYCEIETLDKFIEDNKIEKVNFIKIDTEGHDLYVLKGALTTIRKYIPIIQIEVIDYILQVAGKKVPEVIHYIRSLELYQIYYFVDNSRKLREIKGNIYPKGADLLLLPLENNFSENFKSLIVE